MRNITNIEQFEGTVRTVNAKVVIRANEYTSDDFLQDFSVNSKVDNGGVWIGQVVPRMAKVQLIDNDNIRNVRKGDEIEVFIGVSDDTPITVSVGKLIIESVTFLEDSKQVEIIAYDELKKAQTYSAYPVSYPITIKDLVKENIESLGLTLDESTLDLFQDYTIQSQINFGKDVKVIDVLRVVAEANGSFVYLDLDKKVKFLRPNEENPKQIDKNLIFQMKKDDEYFQFDGLVLADTINQNEVKKFKEGVAEELATNILIIANNPLINQDVNVFINKLTPLLDVKYYPIREMNISSNPALEVGDAISVEGVNYSILEHEISLTRSRLVTEVNEKTEVNYGKDKGIEGDVNYKVQQLQAEIRAIEEIATNARLSADGKNVVYSGKAAPTNPKLNDIWFEPLDNGRTRMSRWNGTKWIVELSEEKFDELRADIEENERIIAEAEERARVKQEEIDGKQKELSDSILAFEEELQNVEDSISTRITSVEGNYSQLTQLVNGIQSEVSNEIDGIKSTQTQLSNLIATKVSSSDVSTIINQSYDSIYLGVQDKVISEIDKNQMTGNEIKAAINLSTDGVDISGKFVSITGETSIANGVIKTAHIGNAQITDAKIGSVSANKITAGTIDARTVNLIYLNASNITTGTLTGTQGSWNLNSGLFRNGSTSNFETRLQYGTMTQYEGGNERIRLNPQGLQFFSKAGTGQHIGMMMSAEYKSTGKHGLTIGHSYPDNAPAFINLGFLNTETFNKTGERTYDPYIILDKWDSLSSIGTSGYPIKVIERAEFRSQTLFNTSIEVKDGIKTGVWTWSGVTGLASAIGGAGFKIVDGEGYGFGFGANGTIWRVQAHSWTTKLI